MNARKYTADEYEDAIGRALAAHDMRATEALLVALALVDIKRADEMLTLLNAGLILANRQPVRVSDEEDAQ